MTHPRKLITILRRPSAMPVRVFAIVLLLVFGIEYAIMLILASLTPPRPDGDSINVIDSTLLTVLLAPALWWLVVRPLQRLFEARGRLLGQVFQAQEDERARIARDLHDELGQQLTAIMIGLRTVQEAPTLQQGRERAATVSRIAADAIDSVRAISRGLRPAILEDLGLRPALDRLCEEFRSINDVDVTLTSDIPQGRRFAPAIETCIYRLLQESLTNAARHAHAAHVRVELSLIDHSVSLTVSDDGEGFNPAEVAPRSSGLQGMKERVAMLDGELTVESKAGGGTRVTAHIPVADHAESRRVRTAGKGEGS